MKRHGGAAASSLTLPVEEMVAGIEPTPPVVARERPLKDRAFSRQLAALILHTPSKHGLAKIREQIPVIATRRERGGGATSLDRSIYRL